MSDPSHQSISELIQQGIEFQNTNRLEEAEACYIEVLKKDPENADAIHLMGMLAFQIQDFKLAIDLIQMAIDLNQKVPLFYNNLGNALVKLGRIDEALSSYTRALELNPQYPEAHFNHANAAHAAGRPAEAIEGYREAIRLAPNFIDAYNNLGLLLRNNDKLEEAIACFRKVHDLDPEHMQAADNLFHALVDKGSDALTDSSFDEAISCFQEALTACPNTSDAYNAYLQMGIAYQNKEDYPEATRQYLNALHLKPDLGEGYYYLGLSFVKQDMIENANTAFREAIKLSSNLGEAYVMLGIIQRDKNQVDQALESFNNAIRANPTQGTTYDKLGLALTHLCQHHQAIECFNKAIEGYRKAQDKIDDDLRTMGLPSKEKGDQLKTAVATTRFHASMAKLSIGLIQQGFEDYEWRLATGKILVSYSEKLYNGESISDKTILIWGEQGVGDELLFASVLPDIVRVAGHCIVECDPRLVTLFARSFPNAEVVPAPRPFLARPLPPDVQFQMSIGSLPRWFRQTIESFPQHNSFLKADPERVAYWRNRQTTLGNGPKIGICWRSGLRNAHRDLHYTELSQWGDILSVEGVVFINLQYDDASKEITVAQDKFGVTIHCFGEINLKDDLDEAAALTQALDLVITAPTSVSGMSGGLGVPTWCMATGKSWDQLGADFYPWMPSLKFINRAVDQPWEEVLSDVAADLTKLVKKRSRASLSYPNSQ